MTISLIKLAPYCAVVSHYDAVVLSHFDRIHFYCYPLKVMPYMAGSHVQDGKRKDSKGPPLQ